MMSVRRSLSTLLVVGAILVALVGLVGTLAAFSSARVTNHLVDDLTPAATSAATVYTDLLTASSSLRSYAISGDQPELQGYRESIAQIEDHSRELQAYGVRDPKLLRLWNAHEAAIELWVEKYAEPRIANGGGPGTYRPKFYRTGAQLFRDAVTTHNALDREIQRQYVAARSNTSARLNATISLIAAASILGVLMLMVLGWWIANSIQRPLAALETVVERLTEGDHAARAEPSGPREVRRVALALNQLADESSRAREVEAQVHRQLRDMDTAKTDFVSNVSHELRTPLTIISGYLELLDDNIEGKLGAEEANMLHVVQRNVMRLRELIEDLLALNLAEHSGTTLELIDVGDVVREVVSDMNFAATNRDLSIQLTRPREPVVILGDSSQLHRAVLNLVSNAVKFSHRGTQIETMVSTDERSVTIKVADHGMGIPQEDLDKLGSRFFRASNAVRSEVAGTGLGLRIVQTIVMNHHGTFTMSSEEGVGTVAVIVFPLADPRPVVAEQTSWSVG